MFALVALETAAIALLGLLVAGLLRSHAEILRQLHHLGAGLQELPARVPALSEGGPIHGDTPDGGVATIALDRPMERTLLLFVSSGCNTCAALWDGLNADALPGIRVVAVTRDATHESPGALIGRTDVPVVMSSAAWDRFRVPGSPYAVLVESGAVIGQGVARTWEQLGSLVGAHLRDVRA